MRELQTKIVRDLAWAISSPGLLVSRIDDARFVADDVGVALLAASEEWLATLDDDSSPLRTFLSTRDAWRLGFYFSALVEFWISECPALGTLKAKFFQQLRDASNDNRVVGSLKYVFAAAPPDAAVRTALAAGSSDDVIVCHWEASIKFFVHAGGSSDLSSFVGPFLHENLAARVAMTRRKLRLSATPAVEDWLGRELGAKSHTFQSASVLRGYLFYEGAGVATAKEVNPMHRRGWCARTFGGVPAAAYYIVLAKAHWLGEVRVPWGSDGWVLDEDELVGALREVACSSRAGLEERLQKELPETPVMIATLELRDEALFETSRGFLVPASWDAAPLLGGPTSWKRRERCSHPTVDRMPKRGVFTTSQEAETDAKEVYVENDLVMDRTPAVDSAAGLLMLLEGQPDPHVKKGKTLSPTKLAKRCAEILAGASVNATRLVVEALQLLYERRGQPRPQKVRLGLALLLGHKKGVDDEMSPETRLKVDKLLDDALQTGELELTLTLRIAEHFGLVGGINLESRFQTALDEAIKSPELLPQRKRLETLARVMGLAGRPRAIASSRLVLAVGLLVEAGAIAAAESIALAPLSGAETDEICVDLPAANALIQACIAHGHSKFASKFARRIGTTGDAPLPPPPEGLYTARVEPAPSVVWVDCAAGLRQATLIVHEATNIALDTEWGDLADRKGPSAPPALLQIALSEEVCYVVDVTACLAMEELQNLLETIFSAGRRVLGFAFGRDRARLEPLLSSAAVHHGRAVVELQPKSSCSLKTAIRLWLHRELDKAEQCSDWDRRPLTEAQLAYAALDAVVLLRLDSAQRQQADRQQATNNGPS